MITGPTMQYPNLVLLVGGVAVIVNPAHAKVLRNGVPADTATCQYSTFERGGIVPVEPCRSK